MFLGTILLEMSVKMFWQWHVKGLISCARPLLFLCSFYSRSCFYRSLIDLSGFNALAGVQDGVGPLARPLCGLDDAVASIQEGVRSGGQVERVCTAEGGNAGW